MQAAGEKPTRRPGETSDRRFLRVAVMCACLTASPSLAFAHMGGMSGEDFRPMAVSAAIAFLSYWIVLLWPSRPSNAKGQQGRSRNIPSDLHVSGQPPQQAKRLRQAPHLRAVGGPYGRDSATSE